MSFRHAGEAVELGAVALECHDERAVGDRAWVGRAPKREAAMAKIAHDELGGFLLAVRREHGAGIEAARMRERRWRALAQRHFVSAARQRERLPQADDTGAADGDVACFGHDEV